MGAWRLVQVGLLEAKVWKGVGLFKSISLARAGLGRKGPNVQSRWSGKRGNSDHGIGKQSLKRYLEEVRAEVRAGTSTATCTGPL